MHFIQRKDRIAKIWSILVDLVSFPLLLISKNSSRFDLLVEIKDVYPKAVTQILKNRCCESFTKQYPWWSHITEKALLYWCFPENFFPESFPVQPFCTTLVYDWFLSFGFVKVWKINFLMIHVSEISKLSLSLSLPSTYLQYSSLMPKAERILLQYPLPAPLSSVKFLFLLFPILNKPSISQ